MRASASAGLQRSSPSMNAQLISFAAQVRPAPRIAILNGFGRSLGDGIIGLQALHLAMQFGTIAARPTLYRLPHLSAAIQSVHAAADVADIRSRAASQLTPETKFGDADDFDRVIDIRDFAFAPDFQCTSMIDFFL